MQQQIEIRNAKGKLIHIAFAENTESKIITVSFALFLKDMKKEGLCFTAKQPNSIKEVEQLYKHYLKYTFSFYKYCPPQHRKSYHFADNQEHNTYYF